MRQKLVSSSKKDVKITIVITSPDGIKCRYNIIEIQRKVAFIQSTSIL